MAIDPSETYVHLAADGSSSQFPGGERFWSRPAAEIDAYGLGWLVSEFEFTSDWTNWEMHPEGDEFVYLLSGQALMHLELPTGVQHVPLVGRAAVIVPRGVWHTATLSVPTRMLFMTRGSGTMHRPASGRAT